MLAVDVAKIIDHGTGIHLVDHVRHKHDERSDTESELEEIYYFEVAPGPQGQPGTAFHRVYGTPERPIDVLAEVRDRDVVLVPHGWHGPCVAAPGHDLYYLNVMAGPGPERAWRISFDPGRAWIRDTWAAEDIDPRLPLTPSGSRALISEEESR